GPERAGADVGATGQLGAIDRFAPEREQAEPAEHEARARPRNADDRHEHQQAGEPPAERHPEASEQEPDQVADQRHPTSIDQAVRTRSRIATRTPTSASTTAIAAAYSARSPSLPASNPWTTAATNTANAMKCSARQARMPMRLRQPKLRC